MSQSEHRQLRIETLPASTPEIGRWLGALADARQRTLQALAGMHADAVNWQPPQGGESIGTLLYHIAAIEADWLYSDILQQELPPDIAALFPVDVRNAHGQLSPVEQDSLADHLARLAAVRTQFLAIFGTMSLAEFRRARSLSKYDVTPEWVIHHLMQHEAEHRSQIAALRVMAEQALR